MSLKNNIIFTVALVIFSTSSIAAIEEQSCDSLKAWTESYDANQFFEPRSGVKLNVLFSDENVVPVFKESVLKWTREDVKQVQGWLGKCRKQAYAKKDKATGEQFYAAIKSLKLAARAMKPIWAEQMRERKQQALQQKEERVKKDDESREQKRSSAERVVKQPKAESKRQKVVFSAEQQASLIAKIDAVPNHQSGYLQLNRIAYELDLSIMSREQRDAYNVAMRQKQEQIKLAMAEQEAKAKAEASKPIDLSQYLSKFVLGDEVDELTINGLRPGQSKKQAANILRNKWGLASDGMTLDASKFAVQSQDRARFKAERRNGGTVSLSTMDDGDVGQFIINDYFLAMSVPTQAQRWLTDKIGKPNKVQPGGGGVFMMWKDSNYRLQVFVSNQLDVFWKGAGYKSRIAMSFWSEDYEDHLEEVNERCEDIKSKNRNEWSSKESTIFMTQCSLGSSRIKPGL